MKYVQKGSLMMPTVTFEQTLGAARQLTPQERARLIAQLATELASLSTPQDFPSPTTDAWTQLQQFRQEFQQVYPNARLAARLDADRAEHTNAVTHIDADDVYP